ncbi:13586_t:CDS:10 [Ambispora gerdemannii]|uniref:13586_t:CDS:1 n=1 Tax=Ambispora gerdemannii TaxID=144530 RepID=A0A9N8V2U2_9GLOM|nr:13586_t:CDS:10 [Ambispora gerdemannii]
MAGRPNFVDPLSVANSDTTQIASSNPLQKESSNLRRAPSHWQKLRERILVEETLPPLPKLTTIVNNNEEQEPESPVSPRSDAGSSSSKSTTHSRANSKHNLQVNPFRNVLRFKTTVQQRTDVDKMEKDLEKLLNRRYGGHIFNNTAGSALGPTGIVGQIPVTELVMKGHRAHKSSLSTQDGGISGNVSEPLNYLGELLELLKRWKNLVKLPSSQIIFAELAKPFFNFPVNVDDCNQALDIFDYIRNTFRNPDPNENFARIQWCCKLLETHHHAIKIRVCDLAENLLNSTAANSYFPTSVTAIHALVYTFVHTLVVTLPTNDRTDETIRLQRMVNGFLERLAAGTLVSIDINEMFIGDAHVQINKYDILARCIFLEGLVKCLLVKHIQLRKYVLANLIEKYWITPDQTMQLSHEHVIQLFAQAAFEILADTKSGDIGTTYGIETLPYYILKILNQSLPAKNLRNISSHVVKSLVSVIISIFSLQFQDSALPRSSSLSTSTVDFFARNSSTLKSSTIESHTTEIAVINLAKKYFEDLWNEGWKTEIIQLVKEALEQDNLERCISIYNQLIYGLNESIGSEIVKETINDFFTKIVKDDPEPFPDLKKLLLALTSTHRPQFYKPMFACVASDSETKVAEYLHLIAILLRHLSGVELFMQDVELMTVIILSDVGESKRTSRLKMDTQKRSSNVNWGSTNLGQCILIMEFVWIVRQLRLQRLNRTKDIKLDESAKKFLIDLEHRLAIYIAAKEKSKLVPMPLRVLLSDLFLEIRLYCKTTNRPGWLSRMIDWLINSTPGTVIYRDSMLGGTNQQPNNPFATLAELRIDEDQLDEVEMIFHRIRVVYATLDDWTSVDGDKDEMLDVPVPVIPKTIPVSPTSHNTLGTSLTPYHEMKRRSTVVTAPAFPWTHQSWISAKTSKQRLHRFTSFTEDIAEAILSLLVAASTTLAADDYARLGPHIWNRFLNDREHKAFNSASFLFIQCGENAPTIVKDIVSRDLYSTNALIRAMTLRKISSLFGHRQQILLHPYISNSTRRRLFRSQPPAIPFVPTDLGSSDMMMYDSTRGPKMKNIASLTADVRRRIQELGWEEQDEIEQERIKRTTTPLSLLPTFFLDDNDLRHGEENASYQKSQEKIGTLRANKTLLFINPTFNKRRATNISILSKISLHIVDLLDDSHGGVYNLAKETILYFLRDDPTLFLRIYLSDLGKSEFQVQRELLTRLRILISMQHFFPPGFTYTLFNHLAGILKCSARDNKSNGFALMIKTIPLLAELVTAINEMAVRDFRKNKIENILCNNGQFWFTEGTPTSMFPRQMIDPRSKFDILNIPMEVFEMAMLRIGHIQFMTNFLIKCPKESYSMKKMIHTFESIRDEFDNSINALSDDERYFPVIPNQNSNSSRIEFKAITRHEKDSRLLSALRARAWLNFLQSLILGLYRNYNDRTELNKLLEGVNTIFLDHQNDFGIVSQTLVLYMKMITRFRRLFDTNRGYAMFIPALFKVFCESEKTQPIRLAITFSWCQFYKVHGESFVFQAVGCLSPLILKGFGKSLALGEWMCTSLYLLFKALNYPMKWTDALGIQEDLSEESDTIDYGVLDPAALLNNVNTALARRAGKLQEDSKIFALDDLLRLFLTIIAYDPGSSRAEQMVQILRYLLPHLLQESSLMKSMVEDGINALTEVFLKFGKTAKSVPQHFSDALSSDPTNSVLGDNSGLSENIPNTARSSRVTEAATMQAYGKQWHQNDRITIKRYFLLLIQTYRKNGGVLSDNIQNKLGNIIRLILKDYSTTTKRSSTKFLKEYIVNVLLHNATFEDGRRPITTFLRHLAPLFRQHYKTMDFSELIDGITLIVTNKCEFALNDQGIASVIREKFLSFGLSVALRPDWEEGERFQLCFCQSLVKLFVAMMVNTDQDLVMELEKTPPSNQFIAYILTPIFLELELENNLFTPMPSTNTLRHQKHKAINYWLRLLAYVIKVCNREFIMRSKTTAFNFLGSSSQTETDTKTDKLPAENIIRNNSKTMPSTVQAAALFMISFNALKIILIRAEIYITAVPGMWLHISQFIRKTLETSAMTQSKSGLYSRGSTPSISNANLLVNPQVADVKQENGSNILINERINVILNSQSITTTPKNLSVSSTALDFVLWTFLELIVFYKLPLNIYLRTFIHQKIDNVTSISNTNNSRNRQSFDLASRSPSPNGAGSRESGRARWKSWGGPPASLQQNNTSSHQMNKEASTTTSTNKLDTIKTLERPEILPTVNYEIGKHSDDNNHNNNRISNTATLGTTMTNATLKSLHNVHRFMGYENGINNHHNSFIKHSPSSLSSSPSPQESRSWTYLQAIRKLKGEKRLIMESYSMVFNLTGSNNRNSSNNNINGVNVENSGYLW